MDSRYIVIPLFRDLVISTDGTSNPLYYDVKSERFKSILLRALSVTLISLTEGENATKDVQWNVVFRSGFDRDHETGDINKLESAATQIDTNASKRHTAFADATKFMAESRLQVSAQNRSGVTAVLTIKVGAILIVETAGV